MTVCMCECRGLMMHFFVKLNPSFFWNKICLNQYLSPWAFFLPNRVCANKENGIRVQTRSEFGFYSNTKKPYMDCLTDLDI